MSNSAPLWHGVEHYLARQLLAADAILDATLADSAAAGLPAIAVSPTEGKFLHLLARATGARRILEVGTLGGYSTIWMARALPADGTLVTLELSPLHADVARINLERAGLTDRVQVIVGQATASLAALVQERAAPFDVIFIDADKENSLPYFEAAVALSRSGTMIVVDNVVRDGAVINAGSTDPSVMGVRRLLEHLATDTRVDATALQTVGSKGHDGMLVAMVR